MTVENKIIPILLCGGSGTRLWPLSRKSYPKQFARLMGRETMFQSSAQRLSGEQFGKPVILTSSDFRFIVTEQLSEIGIDPSAILIEPESRNTAPAILAAALWLQKDDPEALMLIAPSDHIVPDVAAFHKAISVGIEAANAGHLVTFGITPTYPETGYGYLELSEKIDSEYSRTIPLSRFIEKPDRQSADKMLASGNFLWNAGIFLFKVKTIIEAFRTSCPQLLTPVEQSIQNGKPDLGFLRLDPAAWAEAEDISIDYAVMEKADKLSVVPFSSGWSDLGGWDAVWRESEQDENRVALSGNTTAIDCKDTLLRSENEGLTLVGIALENLIAVAMPDAVLIANKDKAQDVKTAVKTLKQNTIRQAETFPVDHRPWGWFETLVLADRFQVKRIVVKPGGSLSLQSHFHRSEHWIVVEGTAKVTIGQNEQLVSENQSVYIPLGEIHRLENPGKIPMVLIEIQTGTYLGEDDITRYKDVYERK
ncbi:MAG TPA: mannose-1-phosphate guanylyltransferase/mannose-6-phosphate isomerase [Rhizobiales bacterium]|nr:mannose-1-phosphate guanylyltransferase/mannose-6-phosphate isomerase [Hyphomicrobiales bacterium]